MEINYFVVFMVLVFLYGLFKKPNSYDDEDCNDMFNPDCPDYWLYGPGSDNWDD